MELDAKPASVHPKPILTGRSTTNVGLFPLDVLSPNSNVVQTDAANINRILSEAERTTFIEFQGPVNSKASSTYKTNCVDIGQPLPIKAAPAGSTASKGTASTAGTAVKTGSKPTTGKKPAPATATKTATGKKPATTKSNTGKKPATKKATPTKKTATKATPAKKPAATSTTAKTSTKTPPKNSVAKE